MVNLWLLPARITSWRLPPLAISQAMRIVEEAVLQTFDDKTFETVEGLADLSALGALERVCDLCVRHCATVAFMSLIVAAKARGRTLMASP